MLREIPDYEYRYSYVNGQPVLVEPSSRRIVYVDALTDTLIQSPPERSRAGISSARSFFTIATEALGAP